MIPVLIAFLVLSCAPLHRAERECPGTEDLMNIYASGKTPKEFRIYGKVRYGPMKVPFLIARFDDIYTVKVPRRDVKVLDGKVCLRDRCYLLPLPPENLVFGGVLRGGEREFCDGGVKVFSERGIVYERTVIFEGKKLREMRIKNLKNGKVIRVIFGERDPRGYFREIKIRTGGTGFKLLIEEVEI
ncbi:MAG: hypothetical protein Q9N34_03135 [Aquificota bacterium]|nr:hypothetical protein [Aquificota bacterium]